MEHLSSHDASIWVPSRVMEDMRTREAKRREEERKQQRKDSIEELRTQLIAVAKEAETTEDAVRYVCRRMATRDNGIVLYPELTLTEAAELVSDAVLGLEAKKNHYYPFPIPTPTK